MAQQWISPNQNTAVAGHGVLPVEQQYLSPPNEIITSMTDYLHQIRFHVNSITDLLAQLKYIRTLSATPREVEQNFHNHDQQFSEQCELEPPMPFANNDRGVGAPMLPHEIMNWMRERHECRASFSAPQEEAVNVNPVLEELRNHWSKVITDMVEEYERGECRLDPQVKEHWPKKRKSSTFLKNLIHKLKVSLNKFPWMPPKNKI